MKNSDQLTIIFRNADQLLKDGKGLSAVKYLLGKALSIQDRHHSQFLIWKAEKIAKRDDLARKQFEFVNPQIESSVIEPRLLPRIALVIMEVLVNTEEPIDVQQLLVRAYENSLGVLGAKLFPSDLERILSRLIKYRLITRSLEVTERGYHYVLENEEKERGELDDTEDRVLSTLEEKESELINSGIYETNIHPKNLAAEITDLTIAQVNDALSSLARKGFVVKIGEGYKSRVAEIVRLLYLVRQRFSPGRRGSRPRLVRSVRLKILPRKIPLYTVPVDDVVLDLERVIKNSPLWSIYQNVWGDAKSLFLNFLENVGIEKFASYQRRAMLSIFQDLLRLQHGATVTQDKLQYGKMITAGTGTGKTEAFLFPHLLILILRKLQSEPKETLLFCIYPRVRLAINQLERFLKYVMEINSQLRSKTENKILVGMSNQYVPSLWNDLVDLSKGYCMVVDRKGTKGLSLIKCPKLYYDKELNLKAECRHVIRVREETAGLLCFDPDEHDVPYVPTRELQTALLPDIMIVTPEMLHRSLMQPKYNSMFKGRVKTFVIDEIHLYEAIHGAQLGMLVRRVLKKLHTFGTSALMIGSSATVAVPTGLFKDVTNVYLREEDVISPSEEDLVESGTELYIFVKPETVALIEAEKRDASEPEIRERRVSPFSTLIQTFMCVMHNARRRKKKYKAIGFIDSVDSLYSWKTKQQDAEENLKLFNIRIHPDLKRENVSRDCMLCNSHPDPRCPLFLEGECWWFPRFDKRQFRPDEPLTIAQVSSVEEIDFDEDWDVVLSTSSLEVGFDDPRILGILQYKAPHSVASFLQRKGRGARNPDERPITVVVLNPYAPKDLYYFQHPEELISSDLPETPINPENYYVQRAHFSASIFDLLATTRNQDYYSITPGHVNPLKTLLSQIEEVVRYWTKDLFPVYYKFYDHRRHLDNLINSIQWGFRENRPWNIVDLSDYIPGSMFEELNIPHVMVGSESRQDISAAMNTLIPGNPTNKYRTNGETSWCPISSLEPGNPVTWVDQGYCRPVANIRVDEIPKAMRPFFRGKNELTLLRPRRIVIESFTDIQFCPSCKQIFRGKKHAHSSRPVEKTSKCYPISTSILRSLGEKRSFASLNPWYKLFGLSGIISDHDYYFGYRKGLEIAKAYIGTQIQLKTSQRGFTKPEEPVTQTFQLPDGTPVLYGYKIDTEGFSVTVNEKELRSLISDMPQELKHLLRRQFFHYLLVSSALSSTELNIYDAGRLSDILTTLDAVSKGKAIQLVDSLPSPEDSVIAISSVRKKFDEIVSISPLETPHLRNCIDFLGFIRSRYYPNMAGIDWDASVAALASSKIREIVLDKLRITRDEVSFMNFCKDVFVHSLKHVFQRAASLVGGVKDDDFQGVFYPYTEYESQGNTTFFVFEKQKGGNGATRTLQNSLVNRPGSYAKKDLMSLVEDFCLCCPTGDVEDVISKKFFSLSYSQIEEMRNELEKAVTGETTGLVSLLMGSLKIFPTNELVSKLFEILSTKSVNGIPIDDFKVHLEIWAAGKLAEDQLGRRPSKDEVMATVHWLRGKKISLKKLRGCESSIVKDLMGILGEDFHFNELGKLRSALDDEKIFTEEVLKRILATCEYACPECLSASCTFLNPILSDHMLNRILLKYVTLKSKEQFTTLPDEPDFESEFSSLLQKNGFLYVRFQAEDFDRVIRKITGTLARWTDKTPYFREARSVFLFDDAFEEILIHEG